MNFEKSLSKENNLTANEIAVLNSNERDRAHLLNKEAFEERIKSDPNPSDDERRMGVYKESIEPQVRDAILTLVGKGYVTIDSGYDGFNFSKGVQYIGFKKGMIDPSLVLSVNKVLNQSLVGATIEHSQRDFFVLTPEGFLTLEEWKKIWDDVAKAFPDRETITPFREKFINKRGH